MAGVHDVEEVRLLIDCGVTEIGIPLVLGYHREDLSVDDAAAIVAACSTQAEFFLITYLDAAADIDALCRRLSVSKVQLHAAVSHAELQRLRDVRPDLYVIKSLIVRDDNLDSLLAEVTAFSPLADAFITDTFDAATGAIGATGKTHDWVVSAKLVAHSSRPVILAGGLGPDNVAAAITSVRPAGVDVHTGVEGADGRKHPDLLRRFMSSARAGFGACAGT